jgi:hypothetical protein
MWPLLVSKDAEFYVDFKNFNLQNAPKQRNSSAHMGSFDTINPKKKNIGTLCTLKVSTSAIKVD